MEVPYLIIDNILNFVELWDLYNYAQISKRFYFNCKSIFNSLPSHIKRELTILFFEFQFRPIFPKTFSKLIRDNKSLLVKYYLLENNSKLKLSERKRDYFIISRGVKLEGLFIDYFNPHPDAHRLLQDIELYSYKQEGRYRNIKWCAVRHDDNWNVILHLTLPFLKIEKVRPRELKHILGYLLARNDLRSYTERIVQTTFCFTQERFEVADTFKDPETNVKVFPFIDFPTTLKNIHCAIDTIVDEMLISKRIFHDSYSLNI